MMPKRTQVARSDPRSKHDTRREARTSAAPGKCRVVGIGASAGGLEAFSRLLNQLSDTTGMGFVLVQHLDPAHESVLARLLSRNTTMRVLEVKDDQSVEPDHVYVIPPNTFMEIKRGVLKLRPRGSASRGSPHSIDFFFASLARDQGRRAIGIVLSGTASDGTLGLQAIKAAGGTTFAQDGSAKYDSMPRSAIAAGGVDFVLSPAKIAKELARIATAATSGRPGSARGSKGSRTEPVKELREARREETRNTTPDAMREILVQLRNRCGVDFSLYKLGTLQRRIARRQGLNRHRTLGEYAAFLRGNERELEALYADMLINVTRFFRNPEAFETLKRRVFPKLVARARRDEPLRVWVLGCATGQEAYSIAMAFVEASDTAASPPRLQIFATDLNDALLDRARQGFYATGLMADVSPERRKRFFVAEEGGYRVNKALREMVIFARQNILSDPPFSHIDLITCRNLLIYLESGLQKRIFPSFHYALEPQGFLFLGASESIGTFTSLFEPVDNKNRIFAKKAGPSLAFQLPISKTRVWSARSRALPAAVAKETAAEEAPEGLRVELNAQREADRITLGRCAPPGVLVDADGDVVQFRGATAAYLAPVAGRASFNVLKMAREGLMLPLRAALQQAKKANRPVRKANVRLEGADRIHRVHLEVIPLRNLRERCYLILFEEAPDTATGNSTTDGARRLPKVQPAARAGKGGARRVAELEQELAETRDYLQATQEQHDAATEELQASNEEVQAANEEAQSANEELQSINEELETSKEELESTNEELITVNDEMVSRNMELNRVNDDLNNLQASTHAAILLLGADLTIRRFTPLAEKALNLLASDLGRPLGQIRHNLDLPNLEQFVAGVIAAGGVTEREVRDKEGRWFFLRIRPYLTVDNRIDGAVLALVDIDALKRSELQCAAARDYAEAIIRTTRDPLVILRADFRVQTASDAFYRAFATSAAETEGRRFFELGQGEWNVPALRRQLAEVLPFKSVFDDFEVVYDGPAGRRNLLLNARKLKTEDGSELILLSIEDVTERLESRAALRRSEIRYRRLFETAKDGTLMLDPGSRKITDANPFITQLLGYPREELLGKELWEIGLLKDEAASQAAVRELQERGFIRYEDLPLVSKTGERRDVEFVSNLYDEDGCQVIQCNIRDITERKEAEAVRLQAIEDLKAARNAAERSSRAKDDFLAALSHELRTPLTPVLLTAAALREDERLSPEVREQLAMIERNVALEAGMIDDLLDLTKVAHGKLPLRAQPCDAHQLIGYALSIVRDEARAKGLIIEQVFGATHHHLVADPTRFQQVVWNLLRNAVKFTPSGGRISIRTANLPPEDAGNHWLRIEVADSGVGIAPENLSRIFLPFNQGGHEGDHRFGGMGLGLAIAHAVVDLHGGRIHAESGGLGRGTKIIFELPEARDSSVVGSAPAAAADRSAGGGSSFGTSAPLRLLVVEDHESSLQALVHLLRRDGHEVVPASTVAQAFVAAEGRTFDLLISDLGLPDGRGDELMERLHRASGLRGIALTGYGAEEDKVRTRAAGFIAHLVKPVSIRDLRRVLAAVAPPGTSGSEPKIC